MRNKNLVLALLVSVVILGFAVMAMAQTPVLIHSSSERSFNTTYRGSTTALAYEPSQGYLVAGWYLYKSGDDPRIIYAAVSLDGGANWDVYPNINLGVGTEMNGRFPCVGAHSSTPVVIYRNAASPEPNVQRQPIIATDLLGWGGGFFENVAVDAQASADTVLYSCYYSFSIDPDNADHWGIGCYHSGNPGQMLLYYNSTDGGKTWSRPIQVVTEIKADSLKPNYIYDLSSSSLGVILGPNNTAFAVNSGLYSEDDDVWRVMYSTSNDGGLTWDGPHLIPGTESLDAGNAQIYRNWCPILDNDGNYHIFAACSDTADPSGAIDFYDFRWDGTNWKITQVTDGKLLERGVVYNNNDYGGNSDTYPMNDPSVGPDGTIYFTYIDCIDTTGGDLKFNMFVTYSQDNGDTWSNPKAIVTDTLWNGRYPSHTARLASDTLHVIYRTYDPNMDTSYLWYLGIPTSDIVTGVDDKGTEAKVAREYYLHQNYPNPFNPETVISFNLPTREHVILTVYNMIGQEITTLVNKKLDAGEHSVIWNAGDMAAGVYFYKINAGSFTDTRKMVLLK